MTKSNLAFLALAGGSLIACSSPASSDDAVGTVVESSPLTAAATTPGKIPAGLPSRLMIGLNEDNGGTWMKSSGVRWDGRYRYLTKGWSNNWGWSPNDGTFALNYMRECDA